jgi:anti-sigma-K factor RskA
MSETGDRRDRAARYVLGLMDNEERERAERDLEVDAAFREAMVEIAERMHMFDRTAAPGDVPRDGWWLIKENISAMPQMRPAPKIEPKPSEPMQPESQATFGRRRSDRRRPTITAETPARSVGTGLNSVSGVRSLALAMALVAAFALGYMAGVTSTASPPAVANSP